MLTVGFYLVLLLLCTNGNNTNNKRLRKVLVDAFMQAAISRQKDNITYIFKIHIF